jgi:hypothetical protein
MVGWIAATVLAGAVSRSASSIWIDLAAVVLLIGLWASIGVYAIWELRRWGSQSLPVVATAFATIGLCVLAVVPWFVRGGTAYAIEIGLFVTFMVIVMACWFAPRRVVAMTGGPRVEWQLLHERYLIAAESAEADREGVDGPGFDRVQALDRFRTPRTTEYIDTYQRLAFAGRDGPIPADEFEALERQFAAAEADLSDSLRARPVWEYELRMRTRAANPAADATGSGPMD